MDIRWGCRRALKEEILSLEHFTDSLRAVMNYWSGLGGEDLRCGWKQFDLMAIPKPLLPSTMVVDIGATMEDNRFRYCGSQMTEIRGSDRTGCSPYDITPKELAQAFYDSHADIINNPRWTAHSYEFEWSTGVEHKHHVLRLPLSDDGETVSQIVVIADFSQSYASGNEELLYGPPA